MKWLARLFQRKPRFIYGYVERPDGAYREGVRKDTKTGRVQFVLHKAGEHGHTDDYWHDMGYGWEQYFIAEDKGVPA